MKRLIITLALVVLSIPAAAQNLRQIIQNSDSLRIVHASTYPAVVFQKADSSSAIVQRLRIGQGLIAYHEQSGFLAVANETGHIGWIPETSVQDRPYAFALSQAAGGGISEQESYLQNIMSKNPVDLTARELEMLRLDNERLLTRQAKSTRTVLAVTLGVTAAALVGSLILNYQASQKLNDILKEIE